MERVDFEMKYIGWNLGDVRVPRHETKGDIELLELKINDVDVLPQLRKILSKEQTSQEETRKRTS